VIRRQSNKTRARGFTLIELMMVVAVIAVLAALAYPSYVDQVRRARRSQAESDLLALAQTLERFHTERMTYTGFTLTTAQQRSPTAGADIYYDVALPAASLTATAYLLTATPRNDQTQDRCGTLSINQAGVRTSSTGVAAQCWQGGR
jgi:type IV pilus assembly protein PilE